MSVSFRIRDENLKRGIRKYWIIRKNKSKNFNAPQFLHCSNKTKPAELLSVKDLGLQYPRLFFTMELEELYISSYPKQVISLTGTLSVQFASKLGQLQKDRRLNEPYPICSPKLNCGLVPWQKDTQTTTLLGF